MVFEQSTAGERQHAAGLLLEGEHFGGAGRSVGKKYEAPNSPSGDQRAPAP